MPGEKIINFNDQSLDLKLRPNIWDEYVGQKSIKKNLQILLSGKLTDNNNEPAQDEQYNMAFSIYETEKIDAIKAMTLTTISITIVKPSTTILIPIGGIQPPTLYTIGL